MVEKQNEMVRDLKTQQDDTHILMSKLNGPIYNPGLPLIFLMLGVFTNCT